MAGAICPLLGTHRVYVCIKNLCGTPPYPYTFRHPCKTRTLAVAASLCRRCCPAGGRSTMASMRPPILRTIDLMKKEWKRKNPIKMHFSFRQKVAFSLFTNVKCHDISRRFFHNGTHFFSPFSSLSLPK